MKASGTIFSFLLLLIEPIISLHAWSCPADLAEKLYTHLKTKIEWVDVNFNSNALKMTIRYFPCFSSRSALDLLIKETINIPFCLIINKGQHLRVENYCVLKNIEFSSNKF
ncbi:MAG: hypothetical protein H0U73_08225 [Tatlockia sp.]|nr:hypothetical protein [Tatlockia sp.]